jgi:hypothetical protein
MHKLQELTANELDFVCGGNRSDAGTGGSDAVSDFLKWLLDHLHVPSSSGGPIRS